MAKTLNQANPAQRRNFRLSPLEMLIVALIILGVLYLMTIWVNSLLNQGSGSRDVQSAPVPLAQMEQVLIASEKASTKLISMEKALEQARKEVAELKKDLAKGSGNKALAIRVSSLEKKLAGSKAGPGGPPLKTDPILMAKVGELEKAVAQNTKLAARVRELEKISANEARLEKSLRALDKRLAASEGLSEKVASLEKKLAGTDKLETRIKELEKKTAADPALVRKVQELEERPTADPDTQARLTVLEKSMDSGKGYESRLRNLESGLVGLAQERGDVSRRLDRMERALAGLQQSKGTATDRVQTAPAITVGNDELAREGIKTLSSQVAELKAQLEKLKAATAKQAAAKAPVPPKAEAPATKAAEAAPKTDTSKQKLIRHKVRRGDTLYGLARKYDVKADDIRRWNPKLRGRKYLWVGEALVVYK